jgi:N-acetylneuraminate synthase
MWGLKMRTTLNIIPKSVHLSPVSIGHDQPVFTIAEIGLNHNGDLDVAKKMIVMAGEAGCSAVKFQNFETDEVYVKGSKAGQYKLLGKDIPIYDLHKTLEIEFEFLSELKEYAELRGLYFFSAPMGKNALATITALNCDLVKIASYEISNLPWVREVAATNIPIIMSCGGARLEEVDRALAEIYKYHKNVALMHCIIKYPAECKDANLQVIKSLQHAFEIPIGFSNNGFKHDDGSIDFREIPYAAAAIGMDVYETHITLDRAMEGVDQGFSTEPDELIEMIDLINQTRNEFLKNKTLSISAEYLGSGIKRTLPSEEYVRNFAFKSVFSTGIIKAGEKLSIDNVKCLRPGEYKPGLEPMYFDILTQYFYAKADIGSFEPISWENVTR